MRVKILGAHQGESRDIRFMSILIDEHLAIDAGGLTTTLTLEEQLKIDAVVITHQHFDHIKDLPMLAHNVWEVKTVHFYCTDDTRRMLESHVFNDMLWPAIHQAHGEYHPLVFHAVEPGRSFDLLGYSVLPVRMTHTVPTVGYCVEREGKRVFYTADTVGEGHPAWGSIRPDLLITETTMSNKFDKEAAMFKHMNPRSLRQELRAFHEMQGYYPRIVCVHINPKYEREVHAELAALSDELKIDIVPGHEGMVIEL